MKLLEQIPFQSMPAVIIAVCLLLLNMSCSHTEEMDSATEKAVLLQTDRDFSRKSMEEGAAEAFRAYLAEDALELPAGSNPVFGRDSIYERMKPDQDKYVLAWEPQDGKAAHSGDLGYTWGKYTITTKGKDGEPVKSHGKYLNVWKKQADGSWKVLVDMGNKSPSPETGEK